MSEAQGRWGSSALPPDILQLTGAAPASRTHLWEGRSTVVVTLAWMPCRRTPRLPGDQVVSCVAHERRCHLCSAFKWGEHTGLDMKPHEASASPRATGRPPAQRAPWLHARTHPAWILHVAALPESVGGASAPSHG